MWEAIRRQEDEAKGRYEDQEAFFFKSASCTYTWAVVTRGIPYSRVGEEERKVECPTLSTGPKGKVVETQHRQFTFSRV
jgi:hypothetical protein